MKRLAFLLILSVLIPIPAFAAFDGARVYWPLPKNTNIVSLHLISGTANAAWTNWSRIQPNVDIDSNTFMLAYTRVQPVFGRTVYWQALLPAGTLRTSTSLPVANDTFVNGLADPTVGAAVNLYGVPGLKAKEFLRHDLDLSAHLGLSITPPLGQYNSSQTLNVGSNQWKFRFAAPLLKALGPWVPGGKTTLEVMPAVVLFTDNHSARGNEIDQDPLYSIEAHLTRDMTRQAFLSLDYTWLEGGEETFTDKATGAVVRESGGLAAHLLGATLGFGINDHMRLFVTHMQTLAEGDDGIELEASLTKITLSWAWHDVLEDVQQFRKD